MNFNWRVDLEFEGGRVTVLCNQSGAKPSYRDAGHDWTPGSMPVRLEDRQSKLSIRRELFLEDYQWLSSDAGYQSTQRILAVDASIKRGNPGKHLIALKNFQYLW